MAGVDGVGGVVSPVAPTEQNPAERPIVLAQATPAADPFALPSRIQTREPPRVVLAEPGTASPAGINPRVNAAVTSLGFRLQGALARPGQNGVVSGTNVAQFLAMMTSGASPEHARQLLDSIGLNGMTQRDAVTQFRALAGDLAAPRDGVTYLMANAVWADRSSPMNPDFVARLRNDFGGTATNLDLQRGADTINRWASQATNGLVPNVVDAGDLRNATFAATSALAFDGKWNTAFDPASTRNAPFTTAAGTSAEVPMMNAPTVAGMTHTAPAGFTAVRLPYRDGNTSMVVIQPQNRDTAAIVRDLSTPEGRQRLLAVQNYRDASGSVALPRFATTSRNDLLPAFRTLGIPGAGPYTGVTTDPVSFGLLRQDATIRNGEAGTVAAAVTTGVRTRGLSFGPPPLLNANSPFVYAIVDDRSGLVTFSGAYNGP